MGVKTLTRSLLIGSSSLLLVAMAPLSAVGQTAPDEPAPEPVAAESAPPPETAAEEPRQKKPPGYYTYNPETRRWETPNWRYDPESGRYVRKEPPPPADNTSPATLDIPAEEASTNIAQLENAPEGSTFDSNTDATINQNLTSTAQSGDASVWHNTLGGNATSGDAAAIANIINLLQSNADLDGSSLATFTHNIYGDVIGDMMIDPAALAYAQLCDCLPPTDWKVNIANNGTINNNISLTAASGDASVEGNTTAGDAASGNAAAMANVVNLINSVIAANQSFIGTINIHGSLTGDILLPPGTLDALLASNAPTVNIDTSELDGSMTATLNSDSEITNNLEATAGSGNANVSGNTTAGNAASGNASTNITVLNLTGHQVIASNSLLVFVNVMGQWVGMIVNAPAGSTSAALANGGAQSSCGGCMPGELNADTNSSINNNISVAAHSGDATVSHNTTAGNATSGNAMAGINLANIINTNLSLSDWFGVLFINVFGTWNGSFGIDTAMGNLPASASGNSTVQEVKVFNFVPAGGSSFKVKPLVSSSSNTSSSDSETNAEGAVLASLMGSDGDGSGSPVLAAVNSHEDGFSFTMPIVGGILAAALLGADKYRNEQRRKATLAAYARRSALSSRVVHSWNHIWNKE